MCLNHDVFYGSWPRDIRRREPARARPHTQADVRVSDAERDQVVQQLSQHTGDGRLTFDEFEDRVAEVYAAKTRRELDATLRNLPRAPVRVRRRIDVANRLRPLVSIALLVLAVVAIGPWILWFAVPVIWCRMAGRRVRQHHRPDRYDELEPARSDEDELTLV